MNIMMVSLGCDKNLCDSETMMGILRKNNYDLTNEEAEADAVIINTCTFIRDAMEESINTILEMAKLKEEGRLKYIIAAGCLAERYKNEIFDEIPEIDACVGTASFDRIVEVIKELERNDNQALNDSESEALRADKEDKKGEHKKVAIFDNIDKLAVSDTHKAIASGTFMGYLKIAEGCDKHCTYCVIPKVRGRYRSVPMDKLIDEASYMAENGIRELILVAQETTCYGKDIYGKKCLHELISKLAKIDGIEWIRVMYCYPEEIYDELIEVFANEPKLLHYIDMPLQHSEDDILRRMGRKTDKKSIIEVIEKLRAKVPDIAIRTSLITGFPGETEEEHESLMEFLDEMELDRVGVFTYSREEGTPAAEFDEQIDEELAEKWRDEIMELQQEISADKNEAMMGQTYKVIIEGYAADDDVYVGRTYKDAPGVDGLVFVNCDYELMSGSIVDVKIKEAGPYDLIGDVEDEFTE
ncbi:MAG: 30S ribosomal protein S12 methylthiotransferase RimO [Lachnospiraceae bacterium]|nr:30S ribosomal protein S12 methylthiotransferase RimO [Lachnospiraceae bacterium]